MVQKENQLLERITKTPQVMVGKPVIRGTRITVDLILTLLSQGMTFEEILEQYPHVKREDILACLCYAEKSMAANLFYPTNEGV